MLLDLLLHPYRKRKMIKTLGLWVETVFLSKTTYVSYFDVRKLGEEYARMAVWTTAVDVIAKIYDEAHLSNEFYSSGMFNRVKRHFDSLTCLGGFTSAANVQIVFVPERGVKARDIIFLAGDLALAKMSDYPTVHVKYADLMFDLSSRKGDPTVATKVYGNKDYTLSIIRLLEEG